MRNHNVLLRPLLHTAAVLILFLAMLSISFANPEVTAFGSFWLLILTILRTLQLLLGMALAVVFCLAFLFAVFFGAVALGSPSAAARMYAGFRQTLIAWIEEIREALPGPCKKKRYCCR
jgi:hypothetical protein